MIVDVNAYYGNWPYWPLINNDVDSMLRKMDQYKIDRVFLGSLKSVFVDPVDGNHEIQDIVSNHSDRFYPAFSYSPYGAGRDHYREDLGGETPVLVKLFPINHSYDPLEEPFINDLLRFCGEHAVPVFIPHRLMMTWRLPTFDIRKIGRLAETHPETTFIIGSVNYLFELQTVLDVLRKRTNVFLETSAMMAFREIESVVNHVGADRLLHGTCNPLQNPAIGPLKIRTAEIPDGEKEQILGGNARRLWRI